MKIVHVTSVVQLQFYEDTKRLFLGCCSSLAVCGGSERSEGQISFKMSIYVLKMNIGENCSTVFMSDFMNLIMCVAEETKSVH